MNFCASMIRGKESGAQYVWVKSTYGIENRGTRWFHKHNQYCFRDAQDYTLFLLKWS
jgi:hypothetical protein